MKIFRFLRLPIRSIKQTGEENKPIYWLNMNLIVLLAYLLTPRV